MCWALGHHIKHFFLTQIHTFYFKLALNSFSGLRTQKNYSGGLHMLSALLLFFQGQRHKRPWIKYQKASDQMANCGFFSSLKSASSCTENKCCLCPLEAADRPSTHRQLFRPLIHTHKQFASSLHLISSMRCTALHFTCPAYPHANNTHTLKWIYIAACPHREARWMWHMPTAPAGLSK